jgi:predicted RND superfamily exporter protein
MFKPSFYVILTTIVGFGSLIASGIIPVIDLGWMMSGGVSVSLLITFILFPVGMMLFDKMKISKEEKEDFLFTEKLATLVESYKKSIISITVLLVVFSITGANYLIVENSFIDYFKKDTEIYKGMYVIDNQLGGTTPLDVIIDFKDSTPVVEEESAEADEFDEFDDELATTENENQYWFTANKMKKIEEIHDYLDSLPEVGKVLSLATTIKVARSVNDGKDLDSLAYAYLYNELPTKYRNILLKPYLDLENNQVRFTVRIIDSMKGLRRDELLSRIQNEINQKLGVPKESIRLANMMVMYNNMLQSLFNSQIKTLGIVLFTLFMMFVILFKSFKVAVIASIVNIVPVGVIFGFMGWSAIPLDMMTITIAAISLGIAVDNTIHYLYRFKIEYKKDGDYLASMHRSHETIGSAMYYTSIIIMFGFSVLALSSFYPTIHFGLLIMLAMFMAIVADLLLLPLLILLVKPFKV